MGLRNRAKAGGLQPEASRGVAAASSPTSQRLLMPAQGLERLELEQLQELE